MRKHLLPSLITLLLLALTLGAVALTADQGFTTTCGRVQNKSGFTIYVTVKSAQSNGIGTHIGPHETGEVCVGR